METLVGIDLAGVDEFEDALDTHGRGCLHTVFTAEERLNAQRLATSATRRIVHRSDGTFVMVKPDR